MCKTWMLQGQEKAQLSQHVSARPLGSSQTSYGEYNHLPFVVISTLLRGVFHQAICIASL
jgi:hypothetical protein